LVVATFFLDRFEINREKRGEEEEEIEEETTTTTKRRNLIVDTHTHTDTHTKLTPILFVS
jgi:hypothetical protein